MMEQIQHELLVLKIPFDSEGNRIRCFPHVINLAVKAGLAALVDLPIYSPDIVLDSGDMPVPEALINNVEYWDALMLDPVGAARKLVTAARASGQRRENFEATIVAGNEAGGWGDPPERLRVVGLLKDVETRWSATFLMGDRVLEQYLAIDKFLNAPEQEDIAHHSFDAMTLRVLQDIRRFLEIFHLVQEIVSAEKTPTLSVVLPLYEKLIVMLNDLAKELGEISHAIKASVEKLEEYLAVSRRTKIYSLAMGEFRGDFP
ncbi:hypothetical protein B0H14DRAFT_2396434 [Mycena olivaceomarginata]|nr:hypothetical protein B0H14DRAFT_2396434 [Mycena olivaceomarginata]